MVIKTWEKISSPYIKTVNIKYTLIIVFIATLLIFTIFM